MPNGDPPTTSGLEPPPEGLQHPPELTADFDGIVLLALPFSEAYAWTLPFVLRYIEYEYEKIGDRFRVFWAMNNSDGKLVREIEDLCASSPIMEMDYLGRFPTGHESIVAARNASIAQAGEHGFSYLYFLDVDNPPTPKPVAQEVLRKKVTDRKFVDELVGDLGLSEEKRPIVWKHTYRPDSVIPRFVEAVTELRKRGPVGSVSGRYRMRGMAKEGGVLPAGTFASTVRFDVNDKEARRIATDPKERWIPLLGFPFGFTVFPKEVFEHLHVPIDKLGYGTEDYGLADQLRAKGFKLWLDKLLYARHMIRDPVNNRIGAY